MNEVCVLSTDKRQLERFGKKRLHLLHEDMAANRVARPESSFIFICLNCYDTVRCLGLVLAHIYYKCAIS